MKTASETARFYDPDQGRDDHGRWAAGAPGVAASGAATGTTVPAAPLPDAAVTPLTREEAAVRTGL